MRKICLTVIGLYAMFLHAFSQSTAPASETGYQAKRLKLEEVNLVSSYYSQNGDHSAVTGGIGTEKVTDISNGISLKWVGWGIHGRKQTLGLGFGFDHHTSASSAYVNKTGASKTGGSRIYPSLNWTVENEAKGRTFGIGAYYSSEYNYHSHGLDILFAQKTHNNGEFSAKLTAYFDQVKMIYPSELVPASDSVTTTTTTGGTTIITSASGQQTVVNSDGTTTTTTTSHYTIPSDPRTTLTESFSFSQVINPRMQASVTVDLVEQSGYLGLPFHRVYFTDGTDKVENLPSNRFKLPLGLRLNYFLGDRIILKAYYRYYMDSWDVQSHTAGIEMPVKISPFFSLSPFYRYYTQTAAKYFAPYSAHLLTDTYYTSNYAYAALNSQSMGLGLRLAPPGGILHSRLGVLELRYAHYTQTTNLTANMVTLSMTFK
ncbi:DUF3570 domain-containing protein [Chitinophaga oryziterrae]|uniref:DUF3570 domain-containing protein n=1 Tax=Chitinophaga oryziterrae TaxID=1031224 RepID=A0A6N8JJ23_9BACT|nr:DUF3570 domain-containing protein [Chitinophaga oryziterrae]MVT44974.1 DUF3570 domain-containing protein [Chitinophaga oryziterrae]